MDKKITKIQVIIVAAVFGTLSLWVWLKPADDFSVTERRQLNQFPKLSADTVLDGTFMEEFDEYAVDQFPLRDGFRGLKAMIHFYVFAQSDNNGIYTEDGYISKIDYPRSDKAQSAAVQKFDSVYEKYIKGTDAKVYHAIIPDKNFYLAEANGYPSYDYKEIFAYYRDQLPYMTHIDLTGTLSLEDFYRTDTHWRQECITDVAGVLAEAMGVPLTEDYEAVTLPTPFYGVYYGQLALPGEPDTITYLQNPLFDACTIINHETGKEIPMYDMEKAAGKDPYEMYLSGSLSLITIENPNATTDRELVIFRDSFGSSLAPLLVEPYAKITILDIRYLNEAMIGQFVEFDNQDVLFIHSTFVLNNETAFR